MNVVQAVFGVFHHFELAHQLRRRGHLQRVYSTWPWARLKREGLPRSLVRTFPLLHTAEYLLGRTGRVHPAPLSKLAAWNALAFDRYTLHQLSRDPHGFPDAFIAISGAGLLTGAEVQRQGGIFLCDRGSTHQRFQDQVVRAEYARWNLPPPLAKPHIFAREEAIYAQADAITVPSSVAKRSFIQMGVPAEKVHVIPYGVRLDKFFPAPSIASTIKGRHSERSEESTHSSLGPAMGTSSVILTNAMNPERIHATTTARAFQPHRPSLTNPDVFHLLFAGGVSLRKGVPYLLQAFAALRHPHKHLTMVGHMSDEIRTLLPRLPTANVTFTGALPQAELARIMACSHALVLPSIEEGLALVQGQAMACGCPVIATAATGAEDLFTNGIEGFILPLSENPTHDLTARMQQLADDPSLHQSMRSAAVARVHQLGGWDHYGDLWESLLHTLTRT
jgi:starch synthase